MHVFNLANNAYNLVNALRQQNFEADLLVEAKQFSMGSPAWELNDKINQDDVYTFTLQKEQYNFPSWIKIWWNDRENFVYPFNIIQLYHFTKGYDLLHLHSSAPLYFQFSRKKFLLHEAGWIDVLRCSDNVTEKLVRRAYKRAECICMTNPHHYRYLPMLEHKRAVFIPFAIDMDRYKPFGKPLYDEPYFLQPSRHFWEFKRNDLLIRAYKRFIKKGFKVRMRMVEWGFQDDIDKSKKLIADLGLSDMVDWINPVPKKQLIQMYNECLGVYDQFGCGSGGTVMYESMSCGTPLVIYLDVKLNKQCYGECPSVINVKTEDEILESMIMLAEDPSVRHKIGQAERDFIRSHNSYSVVSQKLIKLYQEILS